MPSLLHGDEVLGKKLIDRLNSHESSFTYNDPTVEKSVVRGDEKPSIKNASLSIEEIARAAIATSPATLQRETSSRSPRRR